MAALPRPLVRGTKPKVATWSICMQIGAGEAGPTSPSKRTILKLGRHRQRLEGDEVNTAELGSIGEPVWSRPKDVIKANRRRFHSLVLYLNGKECGTPGEHDIKMVRN